MKKRAEISKVLPYFYKKGYLLDYTGLKKPDGPDFFLLEDCLVAASIEPRFNEVLPFAIALHPSECIGELPEDLKLIVVALAAGNECGPDYKGVPYKKIKGFYDFNKRIESKNKL